MSRGHPQTHHDPIGRVTHGAHVLKKGMLLMRAAARRHPSLGPTLVRGLASSATRRVLPTIEDIRGADPRALEDARVDLGKALELVGFSKATESRRSELLRLLATTNLRLGSYLEAESLLDEALDIEDRQLAMTSEPADGGAVRREVSFLLGVCYQKSGRLDRAERMFNGVLAADDAHWRSRFHLALLSVKQGQFDEAEELLARVLDESPGHAAATELLGKLKERRDAEELKLEPPPAPDVAR